MEKEFLEIKSRERLAYIDTEIGDQTIVLVHGNMSSGIHYKPLIERLKDKFRVIAPDMRGFGDSSMNNRFDDLEVLSMDLLYLLNELGIDSYYLAGWSTGGGVALKMAALKPQSVKKLILIESCSYRGYPIFRKDAKGQPLIGKYYESKSDLALDNIQVMPMLKLLDTNNKIGMQTVWDSVIYTVNEPHDKDNELFIKETLKQRNLLDIDWALTRFNMSDKPNGVTKGDGSIKDVTCPVLSLWSEKDIVVPEYMVDETVAALKNARKVILKNSGHSPLVDCPDKLTEEIIKFINE